MKWSPAVRPYWFVDAKWVCGIFLLFCLGAALLLMTAAKLSDERRGPDIAALLIGMTFIRGGSIDVAAAKQELAKQGGVLHPLPNMPEVTVTEPDLALSAQELSLKVFRPLTTVIYTQGVDGAATRYATTPEQKAQFLNGAFYLRPFTKQTHDLLQKLSFIFMTLAFVLAVGVVYFSARWGRLANMGFLLVAMGLPGALLSALLLHPPQHGSGGFGSLPTLLTSDIGSAFAEVYVKVALFGAVLLVAALLGKVITSLVHPGSRPALRS